MKKVRIQIVSCNDFNSWYRKRIGEEFNCRYDMLSGNFQVLQADAPDTKRTYFILSDDARTVTTQRKRKPIFSFKRKQ